MSVISKHQALSLSVTVRFLFTALSDKRNGTVTACVTMGQMYVLAHIKYKKFCFFGSYKQTVSILIHIHFTLLNMDSLYNCDKY
jgi:hypothetical protein